MNDVAGDPSAAGSRRHVRPGDDYDQPDAALLRDWLGDSVYDTQLRRLDRGAEGRPDDDARARFRDVLGRFASGVTVVTGLLDGEPVGLTCQSFSSVSLDPPLVLFVPSRSSRAWPLIRRSGAFCVNLLAADQSALSNTMASRGEDKFGAVAWAASPGTGSPVLPDTLGFVDCTVEAVHEGGDHDVVVGRVVDLVAGRDEDPLLFFRGRYRTTG